MKLNQKLVKLQLLQLDEIYDASMMAEFLHVTFFPKNLCKLLKDSIIFQKHTTPTANITIHFDCRLDGNGNIAENLYDEIKGHLEEWDAGQNHRKFINHQKILEEYDRHLYGDDL